MLICFNPLTNCATESLSCKNKSEEGTTCCNSTLSDLPAVLGSLPFTGLLLYHHAASIFTIQPKVCTLPQSAWRLGYIRTEQNCNYNWLIILAAQGPIPLPGIPNKMTHGTATGFFHPRFRPDFHHSECSSCFLKPRAQYKEQSPLLSFSLSSPFIPGKSPMSTGPNPLFPA